MTMTLDQAFHETLRNVLYSERQLMLSLRTAANRAKSPQLQNALKRQREESRGQGERLERVLRMVLASGCLEFSEPVAANRQVGIAGDAGDAVLAVNVQASEHYEIVRYEALRDWAARLGLAEAVRLLDETLSEKKKSDRLLIQVADRAVLKGTAQDISRDVKLQNGLSE